MIGRDVAFESAGSLSAGGELASSPDRWLARCLTADQQSGVEAMRHNQLAYPWLYGKHSFIARPKLLRIFVLVIGAYLVSHDAVGQTTRTNPSAASTSPTIQSSSVTGPNTPCGAFNSSSSCYSARIPKNPCYSAVSSENPCSTTTTPRPQSPAASSPTRVKTTESK